MTKEWRPINNDPTKPPSLNPGTGDQTQPASYSSQLVPVFLYFFIISCGGTVVVSVTVIRRHASEVHPFQRGGALTTYFIQLPDSVLNVHVGTYLT